MPRARGLLRLSGIQNQSLTDEDEALIAWGTDGGAIEQNAD
jgi:hypothetical protein